MTRVAIPITARREDIDPRQAPNGVVRTLTNLRMKREGGLESAPGWGSSLLFTSGDAAYGIGAIPIEHEGEPLLLCDDCLVTVETAEVYLGTTPGQSAARRVGIGTGDDELEPFGCCVTEDSSGEVHVHSVYWGGGNILYEDRHTITSDNRLVPSGRGSDDNLRPIAVGVSPVALSQKTGNCYADHSTGSPTGLLVKNITDDFSDGWVALSPAVSVTRTLRCINGSSDTIDYLLYEDSVAGTLNYYYWPGGSEVELLTDMDTAADSRKWSACISETNEGTEVLFVCYKHTSGYWKIKVFALADGSLLDVEYCRGSATWAYPTTIGPRFYPPNGKAGLYVLSEIPSTDGVDALARASVSDAWSWYWTSAGITQKRGNRQEGAYNSDTDLSNCYPVSEWAQFGNYSRIAVARLSSTGYDRVYLVRIDNGSVRVDAAFAYGNAAITQGSSAYERRQTALAVHDEMCFVTTAEGSDENAQTIGLYYTEPTLNDTACAGLCAKAGGLTLMTGGIVMAFDGSSAFELGFWQSPAINGSVHTAGSKNWQYTAIIEWRDAAGNLHRSAPSPVITVLNALTTDIEVVFNTFPSNTVGAVVVIYRTVHNGVTFYELNRSNRDVAEAFNDVTTDGDLITRSILYTQGASGALGGQLPYAPPPGCRSIAVSPNRVCLGGIEDPRQVQFSHEFYHGEAPVFSDFDGLRVTMPDEVVGVAWNGSQWLVLGTTSLWAITGDGPDVSGAGSFNPPSSVVSPCGAHSPLSIEATQFGTVFQGSDGHIYLVEPGSTHATELSSPIRDSLADAVAAGDWVRSIVVVDRDSVHTIVFDTDSYRWTFDTVHQLWSSETSPTGRGCVAGGIHYWVGIREGTDRYFVGHSDEPGAVANNWVPHPSPMDVGFELHRLFPFGQDGWGRVREVAVLLSFADDSYVVTITDQDDDTFDALTISAGSSLSSPDPTAWARCAWVPPRQKRESLLLSVSGEGEGLWRFHSIAVEAVEMRGGRRSGTGDGTTTRPTGTPWSDEFTSEFGA